MSQTQSPPQAPSIAHQTVDARLQNLVEATLGGAKILRVVPLKPDTVTAHDGTTKGTGYGKPLRIEVEHQGLLKKLVLHSALPDSFGHNRRADRAAEMLLSADTFGLIPEHVPVLDVGAFRADGGFVSLRETYEFYLLTDYAEGTPYAEDLRRMAQHRAVTGDDLNRADRLADYLAKLHGERLDDSFAYARAIRDLVGSGEGIFGIADSYPNPLSDTLTQHLEQIQRLSLEWRFRLRGRTERLVRTHGDFHPFNVLFNQRSEIVVLDASRGCCGDAADDVTCLAINFIFFALSDASAWPGGMRKLWLGFWERYLTRRDDPELLSVVAPFLAWRALVLASPAWYPEIPEQARVRLLAFAHGALDRDRFDPLEADAIFS